MKPKNQFELMEERIKKLKSYQEYYTQNWGILRNHNFDFNLIEFRFDELLANLKSKETFYDEMVGNVSSKRSISEGLVREKNTLKLQFIIFSQYPRVSISKARLITFRTQIRASTMGRTYWRRGSQSKSSRCRRSSIIETV